QPLCAPAINCLSIVEISEEGECLLEEGQFSTKYSVGNRHSRRIIFTISENIRRVRPLPESEYILINSEGSSILGNSNIRLDCRYQKISNNLNERQYVITDACFEGDNCGPVVEPPIIAKDEKVSKCLKLCLENHPFCDNIELTTHDAKIAIRNLANAPYEPEPKKAEVASIFSELAALASGKNLCAKNEFWFRNSKAEFHGGTCNIPVKYTGSILPGEYHRLIAPVRTEGTKIIEANLLGHKISSATFNIKEYTPFVKYYKNLGDFEKGTALGYEEIDKMYFTLADGMESRVILQGKRQYCTSIQ
ncbi:MAG: hypothetical protein ABJQ63_10175, partial [Lentilitoribacter sp.]